MKRILTIGHSIMGARNMTRDLIEEREENIIETHSSSFLTEETRYMYLPHFHVVPEDLRGLKPFDEVYFMGDFPVQRVTEITEVLNDGYLTANAEIRYFEVDFESPFR